MEQQSETFDAIVIGGGITGMYQAYLLREAGMRVRGYEAGGDFGGTWYWNRYPGCRLDTESYAYGYFAMKGIIPEWTWNERFAGQPDLLRYALAAAERMGIRELFRFNTRIAAAHYDEAANQWEVRSEDGATARCRMLISAAGPLSATRMPDIPGIDTFKGESFHSSRWPIDDADPTRPRQVDFTGKRVGVIGTGATGVQIIPIVAQSAQHLHVFQRSPNWCVPLGNGPLPKEEMDKLRANYDEFLDFLKSTPTSFPYARSTKKASQDTPEERQALFESLYNMPGYGIWLSGYRDLLVNPKSNKYLADFVADKIRQRVKDPLVAEKLTPKNHPFGTRRVPMETRYYEVYNQPNVHLVDINETPIVRVNERGIETSAGQVDLDIIIYATGFDAVTGALDRIDIRGKGGQALKDAWREGPVTYLGLQIAGFPNFFTLVGAHNGAAFCNIGVCGGLQAEWVARMLTTLRDQGKTYSEPEPAAQEAWTQKCYEDFSKTLLTEGDAWWVKSTTNPDGTVTRRTLIFAGEGPVYRAICEDVHNNGYTGFTLR